MQNRTEGNQPKNDSNVYKKLGSGQALTSEDLILILDGNSIDNVVKQKVENAALNEELNEYFKEKRELQEAALENTLLSIMEYTWRKEYEAEQIQEAKKQLQMEAIDDFYSEEYPVIDISAEKDWVNKLMKSMFPENEHIEMREQLSKVEEQAEKAGLKKSDVSRTLTAVLTLAKQSPSLKEFIFSDKNPNNVAERILHVGHHLKHIDFRGSVANIKPLLERIERQYNPENQSSFRPGSSR